MQIKPHPVAPSNSDSMLPLACKTEAVRTPFTEEGESVCSLKLWGKVNRRRHVCGFPPLEKTQRSARDLAQGLLDMRGYWIKGEDWNDIQPGDDPLLIRFTNRLDYPMPRTTFATISFEGVAVWRELRVPKMTYSSFDITSGYQIAHRDATKTGTLSSLQEGVRAVIAAQSGHGLTQGQVIDVMWRRSQGGTQPRQGCRIGIVILEVSGNNITVDLGRGDNWPSQNTKCYIMTDPDETLTVHVWRRDPNPTCSGVNRVCERMKYTALIRNGLRPNVTTIDESNIIKMASGDAQGIGLSVPESITTCQWDNEIVGLHSPGNISNPYGKFHLSNLRPALKWDEFTNLNTGQSIDLILFGNLISATQGHIRQYVVGYGVLRCVYVTGITWDGIEYGMPNPEIFDGEGPAIVLPSDSPWVPTVDNEVSDFPNMEFAYEDWEALEFSGPIPESFLKDFIDQHAENFGSLTNKGEDYTVVPKNHYEQVGGVHIVTTAIPDWCAYTSTPSLWFRGSFHNNDDPLRQVASIVQVQTYFVPWSFESGNRSFNSSLFAESLQGGFDGGTGYGVSVGGYELLDFWESSNLLMMTNSFNNDIEIAYPGSFSQIYLPSNSRVITNETVLLNGAGSGDLPHEDDLLEIYCAGICPYLGLLTGYFQMGWKNFLAEWNITGSMGVVASDIMHNFKNRVASVGVTGAGVTNFQFNEPEFAEHNAEIWVWRRRIGTKTVHKFGPTLFEHSVKDYQYQDSLYITAGVSVVGPKVDVQDILVTQEDIFATAITEQENLENDTRLIRWTDSIAGDLPDLSEISQGVPSNYVTTFESIQIGDIFGVDIDFADSYLPFIKYTFNDDQTGDEDNDGYPVGTTQD